jgi:pimeloyl-ACP methyl ester carboxylesterase
MFWREVGQGQTLLFLHGAWTSSSEWLPMIQVLSAHYHCIAPDLLGFGDSEWSPKVPYSVALEVDCLAEYLDALKLQDVYLIGHSVGAWVAARYALQYPDQIKGLVLINPEGVMPEALPKRWGWARWLVGRPPVMVWGLRSLLPLARLMGHHASILQLLQLRQQLLRSPAACRLLFNRRSAEIRAEQMDKDLAQLLTPTLLLQGEDDRTLTAILTQAYTTAPYAKLHPISDADEQVMTTASLAIAQEIRAFCHS